MLVILRHELQDGASFGTPVLDTGGCLGLVGPGGRGRAWVRSGLRAPRHPTPTSSHTDGYLVTRVGRLAPAHLADSGRSPAPGCDAGGSVRNFHMRPASSTPQTGRASLLFSTNGKVRLFIFLWGGCLVPRVRTKTVSLSFTRSDMLPGLLLTSFFFLFFLRFI